uniref:Uncharacterized protein n=1 Tax=Rhizophora mucronata TaxID=61149 RepID=A0A2P2MEK0_RHIMU
MIALRESTSNKLNALIILLIT